MNKHSIKFSGSSADYFFNGRFSLLKKITDKNRSIIVTDANVYRLHPQKFSGWNCIVLKPGERFKVQSTVDSIIEQLIKMEADRQSILVGVGGGVVTDITGYVAAVYMRGLRFGFVPTTLLGMVDASIGGKNGIDVGVYKNLVGTIRQPSFILYDDQFLETLPAIEWSNGFAEIIKHACIADISLFRKLERHERDSFLRNNRLLTELIVKNAFFKTKTVQADEFEKGPRRLLNFGHTIGHALENLYELSHGQAIAIGMVLACHISERVTGFRETERVAGILEKFKLPPYASFDVQKVMKVLRLDKKREKKDIHFVLLEKLGSAITKALPLKKIEQIISKI